MATEPESIAEVARAIKGLRDYEPLLELIGDRHLVLIGEASYATEESYQVRADLTKWLIEQRLSQRCG